MKELREVYFGYVRLFGCAFLLLAGLNIGSDLCKVPASILGERLLVVAPIFVVATLIAASVPIVVPLIWHRLSKRDGETRQTVQRDGLNPREFVARQRTASPAERVEMTRRFNSWLQEGAKAQGLATLCGVLCLCASAALFFLGFEASDIRTLACSCGVLLVIPGALLVRTGARKERDWRQQNPFKY